MASQEQEKSLVWQTWQAQCSKMQKSPCVLLQKTLCTSAINLPANVQHYFPPQPTNSETWNLQELVNPGIMNPLKVHHIQYVCSLNGYSILRVSTHIDCIIHVWKTCLYNGQCERQPSSLINYLLNWLGSLLQAPKHFVIMQSPCQSLSMFWWPWAPTHLCNIIIVASPWQQMCHRINPTTNAVV